MDTREKIIDATRLRELCANGHRVLTVSGHFDVLTAAQVRRLREIRETNPDTRIVVIVTDPVKPLLPSRARAELVAALDSVDFVMPGPHAALLAEESAHAAETASLINHVRTRRGP